MANVTTHLRASRLNKQVDVGAFIDTITASLAADVANDADRIQLVTITRDSRLFDCCMAISATLGAGCTIKLQRDRAGVYTDLTAATTAGGSDNERMSVAPVDLDVDDIITVLVAGADTAAAATLTVDLLLAGR